MANRDLFEEFVPATRAIVSAVREFHVAPEIAVKHDGEVWIRRNMQMEAWLNPAPAEAVAA